MKKINLADFKATKKTFYRPDILRNKLLETIEKFGRGVTSSEIIFNLSSKYNPSDIKIELQQLVDEQILQRQRGIRPGLEIYKIKVENGSIFSRWFPKSA